MTETRWILALILVSLVAFVGGAVTGYDFGVAAGEETPTATCALCGGPPGEHAVVVLPNEQEGIVLRKEGEPTVCLGSKPFTVCAPCYRQAVGVDKQGEGEE